MKVFESKTQKEGIMKHGLCVIGNGGMGDWHVRRAQAGGVVDVIAVHDIKESRNLFAEEKRGVKAYRTLEEVLADKSIDLVTIATPNDVHESLAIACMEAGKHVISEKPVTLSVASLERMIAASEKYGVKFSVHQNRRWDADYLVMKQLFENQAIGEVLNIESRVHGSRGVPGDWRAMKQYGGGMLYDWGVHMIDQLLMLFKDVKLESLFCQFDHITTNEVDDGFKLTMWFENGARAHIEIGTYNFIILPRFYMQGRHGTALIPDWGKPCQVTECFGWEEKDVTPIQAAAGLTKTMAPRDEITTKSYEIEQPVSDPHDYYRNFCAAIEGKEEQIVTHKQMLRVLRVIEAAFASNEQKQVIRFEE